MWRESRSSRRIYATLSEWCEDHLQPAGVHHDSQIAAEATGRGIPAMRRHSPISWMSASSNSLWLAEEEFHKLLIGCLRNHMTAYANGLYVAVEIPECWATLHWEAARERGGRSREGGVTAACPVREKLFQHSSTSPRSWRLPQSSISFSPRSRFILYPMSAAR